jgi:hypothetical protein
MELLLNLAWMLLLLPASWLWRRGASERAARSLTGLQCVLALGCVVVLLFPVISASDDLHAMRAEMEESATSKRAARQAAGDKNSATVHGLQGPAALLANAVWMPAPHARVLKVSISVCAPLARLCEQHAGRAPPSILG